MTVAKIYDEMQEKYYLPFELDEEVTHANECVDAMPKELKDLFSYVYGSTMDHPHVLDKMPRNIFEGLAIRTFHNMVRLEKRIQKRERRAQRLLEEKENGNIEG